MKKQVSYAYDALRPGLGGLGKLDYEARMKGSEPTMTGGEARAILGDTQVLINGRWSHWTAVSATIQCGMVAALIQDLPAPYRTR